VISTSLALVQSAQAATIVVLQGEDSSFYRRVLSGFNSLATEKITAFRMDAARATAVLAQVKKLAPDLVVTIGRRPSRSWRTPSLHAHHRLPAVGRAGPDLHRAPPRERTAGREFAGAGAGAVPGPEDPRHGLQPEAVTAGLQPARGGGAKLGLRIAALKIDTPSDAKTLINALAGRIDAPLSGSGMPRTSDATALNAVYEFAEKNSVPVVTPRSTIWAAGAPAVTFDPFKLARRPGRRPV